MKLAEQRFLLISNLHSAEEKNLEYLPILQHQPYSGWGGQPFPTPNPQPPSTCISSVTSTNEGITSQSFLTFSSDPFATLV